MSLFGSLLSDMEDDPYFGSHMRHMQQMNTMMSSFLTDPFGMFGGGQLAIGGGQLAIGGGQLGIGGPTHGGALMPFMPQMPTFDKMFSPGMINCNMAAGNSFSSSTVVMSSGPNGRPQVISSTSSTKIGPNGVKETKKTLQDSRTGTKKMSIGHHIGERGHVVSREHNLYSGDHEEEQEYINIEEDEAEQFNREFQQKAGMLSADRHLMPRPHTATSAPRAPLQLALPPPPAHDAHVSEISDDYVRRLPSKNHRPLARKPLRPTLNTLTLDAPSRSTSAREMYSSPHPNRLRNKRHKSQHHNE